MDLAKFKRPRKEKLDDKLTVPLTKSMKAELEEMNNELSIHEMTRAFYDEAITSWRKKKASASNLPSTLNEAS